ncbi:IclR family transcriptional regulator [Alkalilimnicola ehrlichii MLHE-1]|uniref:HTH-type transcriptional repressor AllR n=1 Tax=Alkalilimnicola ehrlichii (strain ATCC BAA-1101 / DSM 17681 / MLHE-1) TaxID=187272 RepID=Q0A920_ALKEH|nr:IclR family transcriptional regulator [Alkalilimnicola ehrlichii]ABI56667.1 transcriptional regulator, IclR family [Alkalilimnicola ehrlichii MLHE-1]
MARASDTVEVSGGTVKSLHRGLRLLQALARVEAGMTLTELADHVDLAPSTTHRLLNTLLHSGFVEVEESTGVWHIGVQALAVGNAFLKGHDFVSLSRPFLRRLTEASGETSNLAVENGGHAVFLSQVECRAIVRAMARPGDRTPLTCSGVGQALLACMSQERVEELIRQHGLPCYTPKTVTTPDQLHQTLARTRQRGWALDDEAQALGMRCVAAPFFNAYGEAVAAISISGPTPRISDARIPVLGDLVARTAAGITHRIGGRPARGFHSPHVGAG